MRGIAPKSTLSGLTPSSMVGFQTHFSKCSERGMGMGMAISVGLMHVCLHPPQTSPRTTVMAGSGPDA